MAIEDVVFVLWTSPCLVPALFRFVYPFNVASSSFFFSKCPTELVHEDQDTSTRTHTDEPRQRNRTYLDLAFSSQYTRKFPCSWKI